ncbi:MAG TPA: sulfatase [Sphingobacteriaceae bacterium]|nr:sulfatase [Sphingobacteriaceae bacterium]
MSEFLKIATLLFGFATIFNVKDLLAVSKQAHTAKKPNVLFVISDDQSFPHTSAYGYKAVNTPAFDRVAKSGVLFTNAYSASPGCSPSRAAILTGMNDWQLEEAGTHASSFSSKYLVYPDILEKAGYFVGYTGKGWSPGNWEISGRKRNPAGTEYNSIKLKNTPEGVSNNDYAANFESFLSKKASDKPFCFWFGAAEPHRVFSKGIGLRSGKKLKDAVVPSFLPDNPEVRSDILDYCYEIEWYDKYLGRILDMLEKSGELNNTIIIVTSDNGMAFPRAKANTYEFGIHVPLAISWPGHIKRKKINQVVSLVDIAPTILEATGVKIPDTAYPMAGKSLLGVLTGKLKPSSVNAMRLEVYSSRERHSFARWNNLGYPQRAVRTGDYLYIRNFKPELWPAGDPQKLEKSDVTGKLQPGKMYGAFHDIDASPTLDFIIEKNSVRNIAPFFNWAVEKRPAEELFNVKKDPGCLNNLAQQPKFLTIKTGIKTKLENYLLATKDPRMLGRGDVFETYPRYEGVSRDFPNN